MAEYRGLMQRTVVVQRNLSLKATLLIYQTTF